MTRKKRHPPAWQIPAIIVSSLMAMALVSAAVVKAGRYITVPDVAEANQAKNEEQDKELTEQEGDINSIRQILVIQQQMYKHQQIDDDWYWDERKRAWRRKPPKPTGGHP